MGSEDTTISEPILEYMFYDIASEHSVKTELDKLKASGCTPKITQIFGGELDGKYDISLLIVDFVLYYGRYFRYKFPNVPIGDVYMAFCEAAAKNIAKGDYSEYQAEKYSDNVAKIKKYRNYLNNTDFEKLYCVRKIQQLYFSADSNNSIAENLKLEKTSLNAYTYVPLASNDREKQNNLSVSQMEDTYIPAESNKDKAIIKQKFDEYQKKGYLPKMNSVLTTKCGGIDVKHLISMPFYAYVDLLCGLFIKEYPAGKDIPLGKVLVMIFERLCQRTADESCKQQYLMFVETIKDNIRQFDSYKASDSNKLLKQWRKRYIQREM